MTTKRKPEVIKPGAYYGYTEAQKRAQQKYMSQMVKINLTVAPERREDIKKTCFRYERKHGCIY